MTAGRGEEEDGSEKTVAASRKEGGIGACQKEMEEKTWTASKKEEEEEEEEDRKEGKEEEEMVQGRPLPLCHRSSAVRKCLEEKRGKSISPLQDVISAHRDVPLGRERERAEGRPLP